MSVASMTSGNVWEMTVPEAGGDYTPCPAGTFPGRICALIDCGHHPEEKTDDKTKVKSIVDTHKLILVFEITKTQPNGQPYTLPMKLTWSMHEKSKFYELVCGITGMKLASGQKFNPLSLLGKNVSVSVVQSPSKKDSSKFNSNIGSVSQWMDGVPEITTWKHEPMSWSIREGIPFPDLAWLPKVYGQSIKEFVESSCESRGMTPGQSKPLPTATPAPTATPGRYSAECLNLMAKYGLQHNYNDNDIAEVSGSRPDGLPAADRDILEQFSTPF